MVKTIQRRHDPAIWLGKHLVFLSSKKAPATMLLREKQKPNKVLHVASQPAAAAPAKQSLNRFFRSFAILRVSLFSSF
jgi:hypothetical protein